MTTTEEIVVQKIAAFEAGQRAGTLLKRDGAVVLSFEPGDRTRYTVTIVDTHRSNAIEPDLSLGGRFAVASTFGAVYGWTGDETMGYYVTEKMVTNGNTHTGEMLSSFLCGVSEVLNLWGR